MRYNHKPWDDGSGGGGEMGRSPNSKPVQILYIGRVDPNHDKVWQGLHQEGVAVAFARTQVAGLQMVRELQPNLVIISTANSHFSGDRLCRTLGRRLPQARLLAILDRGEGHHLEVHERLVHPFTARKLRDTIRRLLDVATPHLLRAGDMELDLIARVVNCPQGKTHLTPKQCRLLAIFMEHPNQVISREDLMKEIWETHYLGDTRTLDVHIRWLREKIEVNPMRPRLLVTQRGVGYKLVVSVVVEPALSSVEDELAEEAELETEEM
jgi:two-component system, OmpR family, phosphate regulon response regulator PhoB